MDNKKREKLKFEDVQNQIGNLKNIDSEFGDLKDKASAVNTQAVKATKSFAEKVKPTFIGIVSVAVLGILTQLIFPWWTIAIVGFWVGYWLHDTPDRSFFYGFLSMFLVWSIYAAYQNSANGGLITNTISGMLGGKISGTQLIYITGLLGGLVTGFATMTGSMLRPLIKKM